jgi:hypothetical protein
MARDKEHGQLTDAELDAVAGGKTKQEKVKELAAELDSAASSSGSIFGRIFGKGAGGADRL